MLAREALQMNPNARAIIRNPLAIPKCEFYDAFRSTQSCFLLFKFHLVNALTEKRSEEHTSELQSQSNLVCRLLLEKKKIICNIASSFFEIPRNDHCFETHFHGCHSYGLITIVQHTVVTDAI